MKSGLVWSREKSAKIKQRLQAKQSKTALNKYVAVFWWERQQQMHFFTGGRVIMDYGLYYDSSWWWICFLQTRTLCLLQMLTDGLEWCGLLVDYCDVFISCLDSHSDGTHSLQSIHCWDTDAVTRGWAQFQQTFIFLVNSSLLSFEDIGDFSHFSNF